MTGGEQEEYAKPSYSKQKTERKTTVVIGLIVAVFTTVGAILFLKRKRKILLDTTPKATDTIQVRSSKGSRRNYNCGHEGPGIFIISVYGEDSNKITDGKRCPECFIAWIKPTVIRCAVCKFPIYPGSSVALYHQANGGLHRNIAMKVGEYYLGCMRCDCAVAEFYGGMWDGHQFISAFGGTTMASATFQGKEPASVAAG